METSNRYCPDLPVFHHSGVMPLIGRSRPGLYPRFAPPGFLQVRMTDNCLWGILTTVVHWFAADGVPLPDGELNIHSAGMDHRCRNLARNPLPAPLPCPKMTFLQAWIPMGRRLGSDRLPRERNPRATSRNGLPLPRRLARSETLDLLVAMAVDDSSPESSNVPITSCPVAISIETP